MILKPLEDSINRLLDNDPLAKSVLDKYAGKSIAINIKASPLRASMLIHRHGINLQPGLNQNCDALIEGNILGIINYLKHGEVSPALNKQYNVIVEGDLDLLNQLARLAQNMKVNWPLLSTEHFGGIATTGLDKLSNLFNKSVANSTSSIKSHVNYLFTEYTVNAVHTYEAEEFFTEIDHLSLRVENLQSQINKLSRQDE